MNEEKEYKINPEWKEYYIFLEKLRRSGIVNMYGATPYIEEFFPETNTYVNGKKLSSTILVSWMENYDEIRKTFYN